MEIIDGKLIFGQWFIVLSYVVIPYLSFVVWTREEGPWEYVRDISRTLGNNHAAFMFTVLLMVNSFFIILAPVVMLLVMPLVVVVGVPFLLVRSVFSVLDLD